MSIIEWRIGFDTSILQPNLFSYREAAAISINHNALEFSLEINDAPVGTPVNISLYSKKAFWLGYVLHATGNIRARVSDFTIRP